MEMRIQSYLKVAALSVLHRGCEVLLAMPPRRLLMLQVHGQLLALARYLSWRLFLSNQVQLMLGGLALSKWAPHFETISWQSRLLHGEQAFQRVQEYCVGLILGRYPAPWQRPYHRARRYSVGQHRR